MYISITVLLEIVYYKHFNFKKHEWELTRWIAKESKQYRSNGNEKD